MVDDLVEKLMSFCISAMIVLFVLGGFTFVVWVVDIAVNSPVAAEAALIQCQEQGYTTYSDFERVPFTREPLGIKCEHPIKNFNIEGSGVGIIPLR